MTTHRLRPIGEAQRRRILKRDNYTCVYCFELATECDHIIPYSYIAKRNTPVYVGEIFERWLMLETTKEWAVRNGRVLPVSIGFTYGS